MASTTHAASDDEVLSVAEDIDSDSGSLLEADLASEDDFPSSEQQDQLVSGSTAAQAQKAIDAAEDRDPSPHPLAHDAWNDEQIASLDAGPAPPDYITATTSNFDNARRHEWNDSINPQIGERSSIANDFDEPGVPNSHVRQRQVNRREDVPNPTADAIPRETERTLRDKEPLRWTLILAFLVVTMVSVALGFNMKPAPPAKRKPLPYRHRDPDRHRNMDKRCHLDSHVDWIDIPWENSTDFTFIDDIERGCESKFGGCLLNGHFDVVTIGATQGDIIPHGLPMLLQISLATSFPYIIDKLNYRRDDDVVTLEAPSLSMRGGDEWNDYDVHSYLGSNLDLSGGPCLDFFVKVYVREDSEFANWVTRLRHFEFNQYIHTTFGAGRPVTRKEFQCRETQGVYVTDLTVIQVQYGNVQICYWNSRETRIETRTGNITGMYAFRDALTVESWSGDVRVGAHPEIRSSTAEGLGAQRLTTTTRTGNTSVEVYHLPRQGFKSCREPESELPEDSDLALNVTVTKLGYDRVSADYALDSLVSEHSSTTGHLCLAYPAEWQGSVEGFSLHGNVHFKSCFVGSQVAMGPENQPAEVRASVNGSVAGTRRGHIRFGSDTGDVTLATGEHNLTTYEMQRHPRRSNEFGWFFHGSKNNQ